jgi:signal transduction histidine kinase
MIRMPPDPRTSLGMRVFLLAVLGMLVPVVVLGLMVRSSLEGLGQQILADRELWAKSLASHLDEALRGDLEVLQQVASLPGLDPATPPTQLQRQALRTAWLRFHDSDVAFLADPAGKVRYAEPTQTPFELSNAVRVAVAEVLASGRPAITGALPDELGQPHVFHLVPVRSWDLRPLGVVGLATDSGGTRLGQMIESARPGPAGTADLLDSDAALLAHRGPAAPEELVPHLRFVHDLVSRHGSVSGTCSGCHGWGSAAADSHEILAVAALAAAPWVLRTRQPEPPAMTLARLTTMRGMGAALALFALSLLFAWGTARSVRQPLAVLETAADRLADGDLAEPLPDLGKDEIGRLGDAFEDMRKALKYSRESLERARDELEDRVEERTAQLAEAHRQLQQRDAEHVQLLRKIITAQEDERRRIARELHDETSQVLAALMLRIDTALSSLPAATGARASLEEVRAMASRALDDVHRLVLDLRPSVLDDLGLQAGIRWIAERHLSPLGISWRCEFEVSRRLPPELESTLFRVSQEAITNIARHAEASSVLIQVEEHEHELLFEIEDDGKGFDTEAVQSPARRRASFGLLGMRERLELLGGTLTIESAPGEGTRITARSPLRSSSTKDA